MKVLFFVRSLDLGGSQRQLAALAAGLARRGHQVVVVMFYGGGSNETTLAGTSVRLIDLEKLGRWDIVRPYVRLWWLIRSERPDILYPFLPTQTALAALLAPLWSATRLVFGVRAAGMQSAYYDSLSSLTYKLEVWTSRRADLIIANAQAGRDDAIRRGMPADRIAIIPNGIDTEAARPDISVRRELRARWNIDDNSFVIGLVARLDPMKDHGNFLDAAAQFSKLEAGARFVCVGGGPDRYRESLEAQAQSLGLGDRIVWAGEIADARTVYNAFDITTLSSAFGEAFPNAVGEAMACGVPVVATDVGDVASIVGALGEIVPPRDAERLCAGWMRLRQRLIDEPDLRRAVRERMVATYGVDAMVAQTEETLTKIL